MQILYHPAVLDHDTGPGHPENRFRLEPFGYSGPTMEIPDGAEFLDLVHPQTYIDMVQEHCARAEPLDGDTRTSTGSFRAATAAVGTTVLAMERGDFALVRPPGHHAYRNEAHGFCLFNNIAIAAQKAVNAGKRVLIIDFDGHLGDGTMDIFYRSDQVLYWSLHQYPAYPGNGSPIEIGAGKGLGFTINCPLPASSGDDIFRHAVEYMLPAAEQFQPDVVGISAGFDAHQFDPLLQLRATGNFYHWIGQTLQQHFPGKLFAALEGGYNLEELPGCVFNFLAGVNGVAMPHPETTTTSGLRTWETYELYLHQAAGLLAQYWKF
ncbi:MAG: histone deacetylase [Lewinellaceae bacterium]|nr:histone deacetylase [Saprospiraceae bacterium]MCB9331689.1 histone deacetylase [Lewinellaceae bacterium]